MNARIPTWLALMVIISCVAVVEAAEDSAVAPNGFVYGHVYDADTKQPLSQAFVYCQEVKCSKPVTTNVTGYFGTSPCFSPSSNYKIECAKYGYEKSTNDIKTDANGNGEVSFYLKHISITASSSLIPVNVTKAVVLPENLTLSTRSFSGTVFEDLNNNGNLDISERGLEGRKINLEQPEGNAIANTTTDMNGVYTFSGLLPGTYTIHEILPSGWSTTMVGCDKSMISILTSDLHPTGLNFANIRLKEYNTIDAAVPVPLPKPASVEVNKPPAVNGLVPDKPSPQLAGAVVTWTSQATDPESDPLVYKFFLNGPATGNHWKEMAGWLSDNKWTWSMTNGDVGENQIEVRVRDGKHAGPEDFDGKITSMFTIESTKRQSNGSDGVKGIISGQILSAANGGPVPRAKIYIRDSNDYVYSGMADNKGHFSSPSMFYPLKTYDVICDTFGYILANQNVMTDANGNAIADISISKEFDVNPETCAAHGGNWQNGECIFVH